LSGAKRDVERLVDGESLVLEFASEEMKAAFREKAEALGVIAR
jgi:hypothetical protein